MELRVTLTLERYEAIIEEQGGKCPICQNRFEKTGKRRPCIDHCHSAGHVRGILCNNCNMAEGLLGTVETIRRLLKYAEANELFYR
jgi:hypothetical protein